MNCQTKKTKISEIDEDDDNLIRIDTKIKNPKSKKNALKDFDEITIDNQSEPQLASYTEEQDFHSNLVDKSFNMTSSYDEVRFEAQNADFQTLEDEFHAKKEK